MTEVTTKYTALPDLIHLDGTTLEGGGQLLRLALSLSSLTRIPFRITDIRGKRGPKSAPGKAGGLKPAHLAGVQWLAGAVCAETEGMIVKSRELLFRPRSANGRNGLSRVLRDSNKTARGPSTTSQDIIDVTSVLTQAQITTNPIVDRRLENIRLCKSPKDTSTSRDAAEAPKREETVGPEIGRQDDIRLKAHIANEISDPAGCVWKDIIEHETLVRRQSFISMSTPGSIFLVLQAILPYILFSQPIPAGVSPGTSETKVPIPIRLIIEGGTNVSKSLSYEYASQVLFPTLHQKLGIEPIKMTLHEHGWSTGRATVGRVTLDITPFKIGQSLPAFSLTNRGGLSRTHVSIYASTGRLRATIRGLVTSKLLQHFPETEILFPVDEDSKHEKRLYLLLVAETSNGFRLGRDWLYDEKISADKQEKLAERLVSKVVADLKKELAHGGCVDECLQDQLVIFQALAEGQSEVRGGDIKGSLHTQTARWVVEKMLGLEFDERGRCSGIGLKAGETTKSS